MAYKSGELQVVVACEGVGDDGFCDCPDRGWVNPPTTDWVSLKPEDVDEEEERPHPTVPLDSRDDYRRAKAAAFLPHSCNEWVVGGVPEIDALIADLKAAREKLVEAGQ